MSKADQDNHANQMNPNNDAYWQSRGWGHPPDDVGEPKFDKGVKPKQSEEQRSKRK